MSRPDDQINRSNPTTLRTHPTIVLLIDDQPMIGEAVRRMLATEDDLIFHYCSDPIQAVQVATEISPTVILQDLVMPEIDGLLLLKFFRANAATRKIPTIVLSVKEEPELKAKAFEAGANDYLVKLPDSVELIARIRYHSEAYINLLQRDEAYLAVQESEQRLRRVLESMPVMMMAFDAEGNVIVWNRECERVTGYLASEIVGKHHIKELLEKSKKLSGLPSIPERLTIKTQEANLPLPIPTASEWEVPCKDGGVKIIAWSNISDRFQIPGWAGWGIGIDITERKQAELSLEREYQQLRQIIKNAPTAMAMFDTQMRYLAYSNKWLVDLELRDRSLLGFCHYDIIPDIKPEWKEAHQRALQGEFVFCSEDRWEREDGAVFYSRWAVQPWYTPENKVGGVIIVDDRIDQLVKARESALENARVKSQFLANMSHEIRTPMNGVLGMAELLMQTELNSKQQEYAETIGISAKHLLSIINDILDFSKLEAGEMSLEKLEFDLYQCIEEVIGLLTSQVEEQGLEISISFDSSIPKNLQGDPGRLRQVLLNLVGNAIKFTPAGSVKVQATLQSETAETVCIYFAVIDTGIGISPAETKKLFKSFSQVDASTSRQYGGTGLGLAICKQLVSLMGGEIGVESEVDKGSTFWFTLELVKSLSGAENPAQFETHFRKYQSLPLIKPAELKILVAEDNTINQAVTLNQLQMLGYEADCVTNGVEALEFLQQQTYDLVLMDCQMPVMDGYTTTQELRRLEGDRHHTIVIALTANAMSADREKCLAAGMDDYLSKPIQQEDLARVIQRWIQHQNIEQLEDKLMEPKQTVAPLPEVQSEQFLVDRERLNRISRGKLSVQKRLLEIFVETTAKDLAKLEVAIAESNFTEINQYAHRFKGSAANVGVPRFSQLAVELEELSRQQDLSTANEIAIAMQHILEQVKAYLQTLTEC